MMNETIVSYAKRIFEKDKAYYNALSYQLMQRHHYRCMYMYYKPLIPWRIVGSMGF